MAKNNKTTNIDINGQKAGQKLVDIQIKVRKLTKEVNGLTVGTDKYNRKVAELAKSKAAISDHHTRVRQLSSAYKEVGKQQSVFKKIAGQVGIFGGIGAAIGLASKAVGSWMNNTIKFTKELSSLRAITGASIKDMVFYRKEAIAIGKDTKQSASEVVEAYKLVGSARPELLKNKEALADVTKQAIILSEAAEIDLSVAVNSLTGSMNQLGAETKDAARYANAYAAGSKAGAANVANLGESIRKAGGAADGYNVSLEQSIGLLETMAEKEIKGSEAGTMLRNVLLNMQTVKALPEKALKDLERFGVNTDLVSDKTVPFQERLKEMAKISGDATAMLHVFGKENITAAQAILKNTDKVEEFTAAVTGTNTALEQQAINNDNLDGDLKSLSSAWEGFTLAIGGADGILRDIVQGGRDVLNWLSDTITAFKEWKTIDIETQFLKLFKALNVLNPAMWLFGDSLRNALDKKIKYNEITSSVIENVEDEARSVDILTKSLAANKEKLDAGNLSQEQTTEVQNENAKIIKTLKELYPELTKNVDLQSASLEDLKRIQKEVTNGAIDQAIQQAKAAEVQKIYQDIIRDTRSLADFKQRDGGTGNQQVAITTLENSLEASKEALKKVDEEFRGLGENIKDLGFNFTQDFDVQNEIIAESKAQIKALNKELANANDDEKKFIQQKIKAHQQLVNSGEKANKDLLNAELERINAVEKEVVEKTEEEIAAEEEKKAARKKATAEAKKEYDKLLKDLEKLKEAEIALTQEAEDKKALASKTGKEKELLAYQQQLDKKYAKEIELANKIIAAENAKTEDVAAAQDKLNNLKALKDEEYRTEKERLDAEYLNKQETQQIAAETRKSEALVNIERAQLNTRLLLAMNAAENIAEEDIKAQAKAAQEISKINQEILAFEHQEKLRQLDADLAAEKKKITESKEFELLSKQEQDALIAELELENGELKKEAEQTFLNSLSEMRRAANAEDAKAMQQVWQTALNNVGGYVQQLQGILNDVNQVQLNNIESEKNEKLSALDDQLRREVITEEEYQKKKTAIDNKAAEEELKIKEKAYKQEKALALVQVAINTALAITKAIATFAPPPSPVGIAAIAAAGITGATQAALIASQPMPQRKKGGYNVVGADDGKTYNADYVGKHKGGMLPSTPSLVLASEEGPEYFVPNPLLSDPTVANHVAAIEAIRLNQFAQGGATQELPTPQVNVNTMDAEMLKYLQINMQLMQKLGYSLENLGVTIGDQQVDDITDRQGELANRRA